MRCLVVVAHPDDEAIWMGGLIIRKTDWDWTLLSLSRSEDLDRLYRFQLAAEEFGAKSYISDLDDSPVLAELSSDYREIIERVTNSVTYEWDLIFTHGPEGEYTRHVRHEEVHRAVTSMVEDSELKGQLVYFAYEDCGGSCIPQLRSDAQIIVHLTDYEFAAKRRIVREIYGFGEGSFEYESAGRIEAFSSSDTRLQGLFEQGAASG